MAGLAGNLLVKAMPCEERPNEPMDETSAQSASPAQAAEMLAISDGVQIFTDGSYEPKSGNGGWAFVVYRNGIEAACEWGGAHQSRDNTMELTALLKAMLWLNRTMPGNPATLVTDCVYAVKGCNSWRQIWRNNGWRKIGPNAKARNRKIVNADLWMAIDGELDRNPQLAITWCKGHSGLAGNERADALAALGRQSASRGRL